jgi:hypothetical protein
VHTYIHAQQMLAALAARAEGASFRRVQQELQLQAARASAAAHRNNISAFSLDVGRPAWPPALPGWLPDPHAASAACPAAMRCRCRH